MLFGLFCCGYIAFYWCCCFVVLLGCWLVCGLLLLLIGMICLFWFVSFVGCLLVLCVVLDCVVFWVCLLWFVVWLFCDGFVLYLYGWLLVGLLFCCSLFNSVALLWVISVVYIVVIVFSLLVFFGCCWLLMFLVLLY